MGKRIVVAAVLLMASGCSGSVPEPTPEMLNVANKRWPGTGMTDLASGRQAFVDHCSGCHSLPAPSLNDESGWRRSVGEMKDRSHLPDSAEEVLVRYLTSAGAMSRGGIVQKESRN